MTKRGKIGIRNVRSNARSIYRSLRRHAGGYLARRPHRSFRRTLRRDYERSLRLPGYVAFTFDVLRTLTVQRRLFVGLVVVYAVLGGIFVGLASQDAYSQLSDLIDATGSDIFTGGLAGISEATLLLVAGVSGSIYPELSDAQRVFAILIALLVWLTTVWLLRAVLSGGSPRLRDGLYNAGAPIAGTAVIVGALIVQLLPATIGIIAFNSAIETGVFSSGFMAMTITIIVGLLILVSAYWVVATFFALVVVTLPGMYPWNALRTAGDIVIGRRTRLLLRLLWLLVLNMISIVITLLPVILIQRWLSGIAPVVGAIPIVPIVFALVSSSLVVWSAAYVYILYRKVVDDDAAPA